MLHEGTLLYLEDDTPRFQTLHIVPRILRDIHPDVTVRMTEDDTFRHLTLVVVDVHTYLATQQDKRLVLRHVMMDRHLRPWLQGIEKPMAFVLQTTMEVVVLS